MFAIPATYKDNNEDYITLPVIFKFIKQNNILVKVGNRETLINAIEEFANTSDDNRNTVAAWIDEVLQEGIKDIHLSYAEYHHKYTTVLSSVKTAQDYVEKYITVKCRHLCDNTYTDKLDLVDVNVEKVKEDLKVSFLFCKKLHMHDKNNMRTKTIDYPIIAEYYINSNWLLIRAKPRSNLYIYNSDGFNIEKSKSTTTENEIKGVKKFLKTIFEFIDSDKRKTSYKIKSSVFKVLDKYTATPIEIQEKLDQHKDAMDTVALQIKKLCNVPDANTDDIISDVSNLFEKYTSIYYPDKNVFTKNKEAYPIKLSATDDEESKVEQTAGVEEPLQTKSIFFDNKKMIYKNQQCDGVKFKWRRKNVLNNQKEYFTVQITTNGKGDCVFKFTEYTSREDIENVLFSIIGAK